MFSIVKFTNEGTVQLVPSCWVDLSKKSCKWPGGPNVTTLIKKKKAPDENWQSHPVQVLQVHGKSEHL
jgi:hypothetical protein